MIDGEGIVGSELASANLYFRQKRYGEAEKLYSELLHKAPWMAEHIRFNIMLARKRQGKSEVVPVKVSPPPVLAVPARWEKRSTIISELGSVEAPAEKLDSKLQKMLLDRFSVKLPTVSVIMPTWNREASIERALNSILAQSVLPLEIIICDDGSTDNTLTLVNKRYGAELSAGRIRIIENSHRGVSAARNSGLAVAKGEVVAYLDSDNAWRPDFVLLMAALFSENDELMCAYGCLQGYRNGEASFRRADIFNRKRLIDGNFIDLNIFMHRRQLYRIYGGFDEGMRRLVDWDLIIRYTRHHEPALLPYVGVDYYLDQNELKNITFSEPLDDYRRHVHLKCLPERVRRGNEPLRMAYVIWDFPALSQTFVMNELRWLVLSGVDVKVYYKVVPDKSADLDFEVVAEQVEDYKALATALRRDERNLCHSHFAYPAVTLLTHPACVEAGIYYTFMPHAVDIFHHNNRKRNEIAKISNHFLCRKVFVYGRFHRDFLVEAGVNAEKVAYNMQAVDLDDFHGRKPPGPLAIKDMGRTARAVVLARFIEKKGIEYLIEAASYVKKYDLTFDIYGYGPLLETYERRIQEIGVNNVHFHGAVSNKEDLTQLYANADMMIVPAVVAENGDMDGFPTVIMEAMAADIPVITTDVSAIPDYITDGIEALVVPEKSGKALGNAIQKLMSMSPLRREALLDNARSFLRRRTGTNQSMRMLMDTWTDRSVDIIMVTFNTPEYEDSVETLEIIRRVLNYTTTPFALTIVDNGSSKSFIAEVESTIAGYENVSLVCKEQNVFCGPASNIALEMGSSEYAIYICSKEGFVSGHGWERSLIKAMDERPDVAMAGHLTALPRYVYGKEYLSHPLFEYFRNPQFARENPERAFRHVQGGAFIVRRSVVLKEGGFSEDVYHNGMDIEYSYYLESLGYSLAAVPEVAAVTVKTRPEVHSFINENTALVHPLTVKSVRSLLDPVVNRRSQLCNICGWVGHSFTGRVRGKVVAMQCPNCESNETGRKLFRMLASDHRLHRQEKLAVLLDDPGFEKAVAGRMFDLSHSGSDEKQFISLLDGVKFSCIVVDAQFMKSKESSWRKVLRSLLVDGLLLVVDASLSGAKADDRGQPTLPEGYDLAHALRHDVGSYYLGLDKQSSRQVGYDWRPVLSVTRVK